MPSENAIGKCHWKKPLKKMPLANAIEKNAIESAIEKNAIENMPLENAIGNCHWKMQLGNGNAKSHSKMPLKIGIEKCH